MMTHGNWPFFLPLMLVFFGTTLGMAFLIFRSSGRRPMSLPVTSPRPRWGLRALFVLFVLALPLSLLVFRMRAEFSARDRISIHLSDDFEAWKKMEAVAPEIPGKDWVNDSAGSRPWHTSVQGIEILGRSPGPRGEIV